MDLNTDFLIIISIVIFVCSLIHGSIGFGFPMIATPLLAMVTDMKTAILYIAIPTLLINFISIVSIVSEGNFFQALKKFYPLAIFGMIGSAIGTQILIHSNTEFFKILLALSIFLYLFIQKFKIHMHWIEKKKRLAIVVFGSLAGIVGGLTNAMGSIMIIYSLESKQTKKDIIQSSNLCFLFGKIIQVILFAVHGSFNEQVLMVSFSSLFTVLFAMYIGLKLKNKIPHVTYMKVIKVVLFVIASFLIYQTI